MSTHVIDRLNAVAGNDPLISPQKEKRSVPGIGAGHDPSRLVDALVRLGVCSPDKAAPLKKIAASGGKVSDVYKVSVYDLDHAFKGVEASVSQRLQFKASLTRAGLLVEDRR